MAVAGRGTPPPLGPPANAKSRFELLDRAGSGTFGSVWRAHDHHLGRLVAVKLLHPGLIDTPAVRERFLREARTVAQLRHPGIAAVHEIHELAGQPAIVSELIDGVTLHELLLRGVPSARACAEFVRQAAEALDYAHSLGVVHRDVKPSNLILEAAGPDGGQPRVVVVDFGLAAAEELGATLTMEGQLIGTPAYMSPEQAAGNTSLVDRRSDVYGLGAVLYELLAGEPPFRGHQASVIGQILRDEPPPPGRRHAGLPRDLESICLKALAKSPADRYPTARALAEDLRRFLDGAEVTARPPGTFERMARWRRRNPLAATLGGAAVMLLVAVAVVSGVSAVRLRREKVATLENLRSAYLAESRARRATTLPGRHFESLRLVRQAAAIRPGTDVRDEAVAALPLVDLELDREWTLRRTDSGQASGVTFNGDLSRCVLLGEKPGDSAVVINLPDSTILRRFTWDTTGHPTHVALSPDGRFYATHGAPGLFSQLWDLETGQELLRTTSGGWQSGEIFSADGRRLVRGLRDGTFVVLELPSGRELRRVACPVIPDVFCVDAAARRVALTFPAGEPGPVHLLDLETGRFEPVQPPLEGSPMAWSPDGSLLVVGHRMVFTIADLTDGHRVRLVGHESGSTAAQWSPDGSLIATRNWDGTTRLWNPETGRQLVKIDGHFVRWKADGSALGFAHLAKVGWWRVADGRICRTLRAGPAENGSGPFGAEFSPDGRRFVTADGDGCRLWESTRGQIRQALFLPSGLTTSAQFDSSGTRIFTIGEQGIRVWPVAASLTAGASPAAEPNAPAAAPRARTILPLPLRFVANPAFSADRHWAVMPRPVERRVLAVNLETGDTVSLRTHDALANRVAISPHGRWVASAAQHNDTLKVWERETGALVLKLVATVGGSAAFSADGRWLLTSSHGAPSRLWELPGLRPHDGTELRAGWFLRQDGLMVESAAEGVLRLLHVESGRELLRLVAPEPHFGYPRDGPGLRTLVVALSQAQLIQHWDLALLRERLAELGMELDPLIATASVPTQPNPHE